MQSGFYCSLSASAANNNSGANTPGFRFSMVGAILSCACFTGQANAQEHDDKAMTPDASRTAVQLPSITVTGAAALDATSEGTGSYAAPYLTIGGKSAVPVMSIPNSVSVITRQRIEDQNLVSADEALAQVTGVTVTPWDGTSTQIRSRGYFLEPTYDGIPAFGGLNATQQYDVAMFDRIEVLRGPAGLFQGSGQPGGTVNFVRKRAPSELQGSASGTYGSWSNKRLEADVGLPLNTQGTLKGRIVATAQDRDFYYDGASSRKNFVYGTLDFQLSPSTSFSLYGAFQDDTTNPFMGLPAYTDGSFIDAPRSTNPMAPWSRYDTQNSTVAALAEHTLQNGWRIQLNTSHSQRDSQIHDGYPTSGVDPVSGNIASYMRRGWDDTSTRNAVDIYANGPFKLFDRHHEATIGYNYERYRGDTKYGAFLPFDNVPFGQSDRVPYTDIEPYMRGVGYETRQSGFYGQLRLSVTEPLTIVLGGRLSDFTTRSRSSWPSTVTDWSTNSRERGEFTPYAGIVYRLNEQLAVYTSYSDIFMPQSQKDLSGRTLDPREGKQIEIGIKGTANDGQLQFSASVFRTRDVNRSFADVDNPGFFLSAGEVQIK
ncbi:MAG TPA: TonB-dependent siderophore receptor, partial [Pusillimonas sp.]|nr:TonB-dependent siderophore receptor [Pusillimonas sp.]